jgi:Transglycosylase SLT domain
MRHLLVPACLCLMTLPGPTGKELRLPLDSFAAVTAATKKLFTESAAPETTKDIDTITAAIDASAGDTSQSDDDARHKISRTTFEPGDVLDSDDSIVPFPPPLPPVRRPVVERSRAEICETLTKEAQANDVPAPFFINLLFQESGFQAGMVSDAGAEGIAQFMPETSADVGLENPYDPLQAIPAAARLLRSLAREFGNLGLAAAAYNAGPRRIQDWLANKGKLPQETQGYVKTITGRAPETFTAAAKGSPAMKLPRHAPCQEAAGLLAWDGPEHIPLPPVHETKKDAARLANAAQEGKRTGEKIVEKAPTHTASEMTAKDAAEKKTEAKKEAKDTAKKPEHAATKTAAAKAIVGEAKSPAMPAAAAKSSEKKSAAHEAKPVMAQVAAARHRHAHKSEKVAQN